LKFTRQDNSLFPRGTQLPKNSTICSSEVEIHMELTESRLGLKCGGRIQITRKFECHSLVRVRARLHGASFRGTRSIGLEADCGMKSRMSSNCAHG